MDEWLLDYLECMLSFSLFRRFFKVEKKAMEYFRCASKVLAKAGRSMSGF
ncbi:hypothetical protein SAMN04488137_3950 [Fictibacillus solisalsi]|uniref:Uncharacterized protein n=1 Tax=Fictibacillus solisalsi TaxID=459525 RepID=A0A1H0A676_9BACL|nr:hypothetical protein [Fictibacillus solisalsi]SDN29129.1 hypothetical protein SAMN04488137_3950 [Fictibacillus solisalsi]